MSLVSKKILGIPIITSSKNDILEEVRKFLKFPIKKINPLIIFTPNPEIIEYAQSNSEFKRILNTASINLPDGEGVVWATHHIYKEKITRITGVDFMLDLCNLAKKESIRIGLIGGKDQVALQTAECLSNKYPGLKAEIFEVGEIEMSKLKTQSSKLQSRHAEPRLDRGNLVSASSKYKSQIPNQVRDDIENIIHWIEKKEIGILFVALGFPKQEYFIENSKLKTQNSKLRYPLVLMAVGGSFDYISGKVPRAPVWIRDRGLEWLYRLIKEPSRIVRQLRGGRFFLRVLRDKYSKKTQIC